MPPSARTRLDQARSVVLDGSGFGVVEFAGTYGDVWEVGRVTVSTASNATPIPIATVYKGSRQPTSIVGATYTGNLDTMGGAPPELFVDGESLIVEWIDGNPGDTATATIAGWISVGGSQGR